MLEKVLIIWIFFRPGDSNYLPPLLTVDLCFYLGDDVLDSHVKYFDFFDGSIESYRLYVNYLTHEANRILSEYFFDLLPRKPKV